MLGPKKRMMTEHGRLISACRSQIQSLHRISELECEDCSWGILLPAEIGAVSLGSKNRDLRWFKRSSSGKAWRIQPWSGLLAKTDLKVQNWRFMDSNPLPIALKETWDIATGFAEWQTDCRDPAWANAGRGHSDSRHWRTLPEGWRGEEETKGDKKKAAGSRAESTGISTKPLPELAKSQKSSPFPARKTP